MTTHYKLAIALGAMTALGPLAIDMYVPAMPDMAQDLATSDGAIHRSAMSFFFGFMLGQLVYGPLSDRFGRRYVVLSALSIFLVASVGCTMSGSVESLVVWRLVQGFGGAAGMSMAIAITRDLYVGKEAGRMMSLIMMVMGLAPILAPLLGSAIITIAPWPIIFLVLVFFALLAMTLTLLWVPETLPPADRNKSSGNVLTHYWQLLISQSFMPYAGTLALIQGAFFAYIVGSSFVIIKVFGLSSTQYALLFGLNAIGLTVGTQLLGRLGERIGAHRLVRAAVGGFVALSALALVLSLTGALTLLSLSVLLFLAIFLMGGIMPGCNQLAMEHNGAMAGTAASLLGALGFGMGVVSSAILSLAESGTATPLLAIMTGFSGLALIVFTVLMPKGYSSYAPE